MFGTIVNTAAVIAGAILGLLLKKGNSRAVSRCHHEGIGALCAFDWHFRRT